MQKFFATCALLLMSAGETYANEETYFGGAYISAEAGYFDINPNVDGVYTGGTIGYRVQTDAGLVYGIEGSIGKSFIDVGTADDVIDNQWSIVGFLGGAFGKEKRNLYTIGLGYSGLKASAFGNTDTEQFFTAQLGFERALGKSFLLRAKATTYEFDTLLGTIGIGYRF